MAHFERIPELTKKYLYEVPADAVGRLAARYLVGTMGDKFWTLIKERKDLLGTDTGEVDNFFRMASQGFMLALRMEKIQEDALEPEKIFRDANPYLDTVLPKDPTFSWTVFSHVNFTLRTLCQRQVVYFRELDESDHYPFPPLADTFTNWSSLRFTEAVWATTQEIGQISHARLQAPVSSPLPEQETRKLLKALHFFQASMALSRGFDQLPG